MSNANSPVSGHRRKPFPWLFLLMLAGVLALWWPILKGLGYRVAGSNADDGIPWRTDFSAALAEARQAGKPVLLDFTASWCPPCQIMKHEVWPTEEVRQLVSERFIPVLLDVDQAASRTATARYGVNAIPTIIIVDADGNQLKRGNFMSRDAMVRFLGQQ